MTYYNIYFLGCDAVFHMYIPVHHPVKSVAAQSISQVQLKVFKRERGWGGVGGLTSLIAPLPFKCPREHSSRPAFIALRHVIFSP